MELDSSSRCDSRIRRNTKHVRYLTATNPPAPTGSMMKLSHTHMRHMCVCAFPVVWHVCGLLRGPIPRFWGAYLSLQRTPSSTTLENTHSDRKRTPGRPIRSHTQGLRLADRKHMLKGQRRWEDTLGSAKLGIQTPTVGYKATRTQLLLGEWCHF